MSQESPNGSILKGVAILEGEMRNIAQIAALPNCPISPTQTLNVLDHMLAAAMYILGDNDAYRDGAGKIMREAGNYLNSIDPTFGQAITGFGERLFNDVDPVAIATLAAQTGIVSHGLPEDIEIYEQFRSGHVRKEEVTHWLLNNPVQRNAS